MCERDLKNLGRLTRIIRGALTQGNQVTRGKTPESVHGHG